MYALYIHTIISNIQVYNVHINLKKNIYIIYLYIYTCIYKLYIYTCIYKLYIYSVYYCFVIWQILIIGCPAELDTE